MKYTLFEQIRLAIPKWVWGLLTVLYMVVTCVGMPLMAVYGVYRLVMYFFGFDCPTK